MKKLDDNFRFALKMLIMGENPAEGGAETSQRFLKNLSWFRPKPWKVLHETLEGFQESLRTRSFVFLANSKKSFQCFRKSSMKFCEKF